MSRMEGKPLRLGRAMTLPCRSCRFLIPFVARPGRYSLGCPECRAGTAIEVVLRNAAFQIVSISNT